MKTYQGEQLAVMANTVAEARHSLTVPEQRLMLWLIAQIEREDQALQEHTITVPEMEAVLGNNNGRLYEQMEAMCDRLQSRVLEICYPKQKERIKHNWLHSIRYHDGEGRITFRIHDLLAPVFLKLNTQFCKIPILAAFQLRGGYAIRWLERLMARLPLGPWEMSVAELREWLHVAEDELIATGHLVSRAIEYPRKELEAKTEVSFDYEPLRRGKKVVGWIFTPRTNKPAKPAKPLPLAGLGVSRGKIRKAGKATVIKTPDLNPPAPQVPALNPQEFFPFVQPAMSVQASMRELRVKFAEEANATVAGKVTPVERKGPPDPIGAAVFSLKRSRHALTEAKNSAVPDSDIIVKHENDVARDEDHLRTIDPSNESLIENGRA